MKQNEIYKEVVCDYFDTYNKCWCVDAWTDPEVEDNGCVVARIDGQSGNVYYMDDAAKDSPLAQEVIRLKQAEVRAEKKKVWLVEIADLDREDNYLDSFTEVFDNEQSAKARVDEIVSMKENGEDEVDASEELAGVYGRVIYFMNDNICKVKVRETLIQSVNKENK